MHNKSIEGQGRCDDKSKEGKGFSELGNSRDARTVFLSKILGGVVSEKRQRMSKKPLRGAADYWRQSSYLILLG
jgi:hypothetical protein